MPPVSSAFARMSPANRSLVQGLEGIRKSLNFAQRASFLPESSNKEVHAGQLFSGFLKRTSTRARDQIYETEAIVQQAIQGDVPDHEVSMAMVRGSATLQQFSSLLNGVTQAYQEVLRTNI